MNDENDLLTVAEKSVRKGVKNDMVIGKVLQRLMLKDWCRGISSEDIMARFEAIICHCGKKKNKLTIFATRRFANDRNPFCTSRT